MPVRGDGTVIPLCLEMLDNQVFEMLQFKCRELRA
jgi:hypothetical protein